MARRAAVIVGLVAALLAPGVSASASAKPEVVDDFTFGPLVDGFLSFVFSDACGFEILWEVEGRVRHVHFKDADGNTVRHQTWAQGTDWVTNVGTGGTLHGRWANSDFLVGPDDVSEGQIAVNGLKFHLNAPGFGNVLMDTGRAVFDFATGELLFLAGQDDFLSFITGADPTAVDDFCAAMAGV